MNKIERKLIPSTLSFLFLLLMLASCTKENNAPPDSNQKFAVLSDVHIGLDSVDREGQLYSHSREILSDTIAAINADTDIKFVLISGDITKDGLLTEHDSFKELISQINVPVYLIPGNHDIEHPGKEGADYMKKVDFPQFYADFGYATVSSTYYAAEVVDGIILVGLDSNIYSATEEINADYGGSLPAEQLTWLESVLNDSVGKKVIVMVHHNINEHVYRQATDDYLNDFYLYNASELKQILKEHNVSVVFTGHSHLVDIKEEDGIYDIVTTSLIMYPLGYRICTIRNNSILVEGAAVVTDPINGVVANDYAYTLLFNYGYDQLYAYLTSAPYNYPPLTATIMANQLTNATLKVFNGDENIEGLPGVPAEYLLYFQDAPPSDNTAEVPF